MEKCYMCNDDGTTIEHVPPKCIFPEAKDLENNENMKKQLITVPSCEKHNSAKSKDDLYILFVLAINVLSNNYATQLTKTKLLRAAKRSPHVFKEFMRERLPVAIQNDHDIDFEYTAIKIDTPRFENSIKHMAYALFYENFKSHFTGEVSIFSNSIINLQNKNSQKINHHTDNICEDIEKLLRNTEFKGSNPEIFKYRFLKLSLITEQNYYLQIKFYDHFNITAIMKN